MDGSVSARTTCFEEFVADRIRYRVCRLQRVFRVSEHDAEDLTQHMHMAVVSAMVRYRSGQASDRTYVCRVLDREYCNLAKKLRKRRTSPIALESVAFDVPDVRDSRPCIDLALDVAEAVSALPDGLRMTALAIMHHEPTDAASSRGLHRGTIYRQMRAMEPYLVQLVRDD